LFAINIDIDWAPDEVVEYALDILDEFSARATLFCTHAMNAGTRSHELCIHPNFTDGADKAVIVDSLCGMFPDARGVRAHGSLFSYYLAGLYAERGLIFDASYYFPAGPCKPYNMFQGMMEIPYYFIDDLFFKEGGLEEPCLSDSADGVKVFVFHPVHLFLNTDTPQRYQDAKKFYKEPARLREFRNAGRGTETFFRKLLGYTAENNIPLLTMSEIYERFE
jgi:hypothetical protein